MPRNFMETIITNLERRFRPGFDFSLDRILALLHLLGNPHKVLPPVIHITGTNGKGSAAAFSRALLEASGYLVHVHTSPHLIHWHERFRLASAGGGRFVADDVLARAISRVVNANENENMTVFEILTAVMFLLFHEHPADAVVIEVGLGGRLDATNVIESPAVSMIMPISLDHEAFLGNTEELIAHEKAGIIKSCAPVVIGPQESVAALGVLIEIAAQKKAPTFIFEKDFFVSCEKSRLIYKDATGLMNLSPPHLAGEYQFKNAATAIAAVRAAGFEVSEKSAELAMQTVYWPARMELISEGRLLSLAPKDAEIRVDGSHNPGGAAVIAATLRTMQEESPRPLFLICGIMKTKDHPGYFRAFKGLVDHVYTVPVPDNEEGLAPSELACCAQGEGLSASVADSVGHALQILQKTQEPKKIPPRIVITGSLYLAGSVLKENGTAIA